MNEFFNTSWLTTQKAAELLLIKADTLRSAYCRKGEYYGIKPFKLKTGKLLWKKNDVESFFQNN